MLTIDDDTRVQDARSRLDALDRRLASARAERSQLLVRCAELENAKHEALIASDLNADAPAVVQLDTEIREMTASVERVSTLIVAAQDASKRQAATVKSVVQRARLDLREVLTAQVQAAIAEQRVHFREIAKGQAVLQAAHDSGLLEPLPVIFFMGTAHLSAWLKAADQFCRTEAAAAPVEV